MGIVQNLYGENLTSLSNLQRGTSHVYYVALHSCSCVSSRVCVCTNGADFSFLFPLMPVFHSSDLTCSCLLFSVFSYGLRIKSGRLTGGWYWNTEGYVKNFPLKFWASSYQSCMSTATNI